MLSLLILGLFAVLSGYLASEKNRSVILWALLGLFFGPFGLIVGFLKKVETSSDESKDFTVPINKDPNSQKMITYTIYANSNDNGWNNARSILLSYYNQNYLNEYRIKNNDSELLFAVKTEDGKEISYFRMRSDYRKDGYYILVEAFEGIDFKSIGPVTKSYEKSDEIASMPNIDDFVKIAELYKQGLLTEEEYQKQKEKYGLA